MAAPLSFGLGKHDVATSLAMLARVGGLDGGAAAAELDGIKEALLQAEATEAYLAAKQDEIANALLAAAASSANASDAMTKALLAAAVTNPLSASDIETLLAAVATSSAVPDYGLHGLDEPDPLTKALLAAALNNPLSAGDLDSLLAASAGLGHPLDVSSASASAEPPDESPAPTPSNESDALTKALLEAAGSAPSSSEDSLLAALASNTSTPALEAASSASVPDEMTKALLAAVATNTPSAAGDADKIIKAVLRAATASQVDGGTAFGEKDSIEAAPPEQKRVEKPTPPPVAEPENKEPPKEIKEKPRPREGIVSTEVLKTLAENAKASARSIAARSQNVLASAAASASKAKEGSKNVAGKDSPNDSARNAEAEKPVESGTKAWIFLGRVPKGTSGGLIRAECAKYGTVTSILYNAEPDSLFEEPWALVSLTSLDSAATAVQKLECRRGLFGGSQPVEVRMGTPEDLERWEELVKAGEQLKPAAPTQGTSGPVSQELVPVEDGYGRSPYQDGYNRRRRGHHDQEQHRSRSRSRRDTGQRARRGDSRESGRQKGRESREREYSRRDYRRSVSESRSPSRDAIPKPPTGKRVYGLGGFDNSLALENVKMPKVSPADMVPSSDRRIGTRGSWAEFVTREWEYYYVNIHTGEKRWMLPVAEMRGVAPRRS